nr:putative ORF1 [Marmot picobirnavirus]
MTANQIAYYQAYNARQHNRAMEQLEANKLSETHRSNVANEIETSRSHRANEAETYRSNLAREHETSRANREREHETKRMNTLTIGETRRANRANEALKHEANTITLSNSINSIFEAQRHNQATEALTAQQLSDNWQLKQAGLKIDASKADTEKAKLQFTINQSVIDNELKVSQAAANYATAAQKESQTRWAGFNNVTSGVSSILHAVSPFAAIGG